MEPQQQHLESDTEKKSPVNSGLTSSQGNHIEIQHDPYVDMAEEMYFFGVKNHQQLSIWDYLGMYPQSCLAGIYGWLFPAILPVVS